MTKDEFTASQNRQRISRYSKYNRSTFISLSSVTLFDAIFADSFRLPTICKVTRGSQLLYLIYSVTYENEIFMPFTNG